MVTDGFCVRKSEGEEIVAVKIKKESLNLIFERQHEISKNVVCATSKGSDQHAHTCSLIRAFASRLNIL